MQDRTGRAHRGIMIFIKLTNIISLGGWGSYYSKLRLTCQYTLSFIWMMHRDRPKQCYSSTTEWEIQWITFPLFIRSLFHSFICSFPGRDPASLANYLHYWKIYPNPQDVWIKIAKISGFDVHCRWSSRSCKTNQSEICRSIKSAWWIASD